MSTFLHMKLAICGGGFFMIFFPYRSCSPKRRKLMGAGEYPSPKASHRWSADSTTSSSSSETSLVQLQTGPRTDEMGLSLTVAPSPLSRVPTEGSGMEVEAAQRRLQEIEER